MYISDSRVVMSCTTTIDHKSHIQSANVSLGAVKTKSKTSGVAKPYKGEFFCSQLFSHEWGKLQFLIDRASENLANLISPQKRANELICYILFGYIQKT